MPDSTDASNNYTIGVDPAVPVTSTTNPSYTTIEFVPSVPADIQQEVQRQVEAGVRDAYERIGNTDYFWHHPIRDLAIPSMPPPSSPLVDMRNHLEECSQDMDLLIHIDGYKLTCKKCGYSAEIERDYLNDTECLRKFHDIVNLYASSVQTEKMREKASDDLKNLKEDIKKSEDKYTDSISNLEI